MTPRCYTTPRDTIDHRQGPGAVPCLRRGGQDAQPGHIINEFKAKAELAKTDVEMIFGRRQIVIDGSYHPLRTFSGPELRAVRRLADP
jgi:hypothetical protein